MRPFNVAKWLSKIVSVTLDYLGLRSAAVSSTVAGALFDDRDRPPTVSRAPNQRAPAKTAEVILEAQLKAILVKVGWDDVKEAEYAEVVDNLRRIVNNKPADASAGAPFERSECGAGHSSHCITFSFCSKCRWIVRSLRMRSPIAPT